MSIKDKLLDIYKSDEVNQEHDVSASELSRLICDLFSEILLLNDNEDEIFDNWIMELRLQKCKIINNGHEWEYDQCGYWGHQYCIGCNRSKYPELSSLSCSEAIEKIGKITEEQYNGQ